MERPEIISSDQLALTAAVYVRQSTAIQVERNTGSTEYQRAQVDWALRWGWPLERTKLFEDLGMSGTAALHRPQYMTLREWIRARRIGCVFVSDLTRLGRDTKELLEFIRECTIYNGLIVVDGKVLNLRDTSEWFTTGLFALLAEFGGLTIRDTLQRGRTAKLRAGKAVSAPPAGYVSQPDKSWIKDPDPIVRAGVLAVFSAFLEHRTLRAAVVALRAAGLNIPRKRPGRPVHWAEPIVHSVYDMVRHPAYRGEYCYRRHIDDHTKPRSAKGRVRPRHATANEIVHVPDHHEPYISPEQAKEVDAILQSNGWSRDRANVGRGRAQCQGITGCRQHGNIMSVRYKTGSGGRSYSYGCQGEYCRGGRSCINVPGAPIDYAVASAVMARLTPPSLAMLRSAVEDALADEAGLHRRRQMELQRLRNEASDLERKLVLLDPGSHRVFKILTGELEKKSRQVEDLERLAAMSNGRDVRLEVEMLTELEVLASDLPSIWYAATTTDRDRKELNRTLVRRVVIEGRDAERIDLCIEWNDDWPSEKRRVWLARGVRRIIAEMAERGTSVENILAELNRLQVRTSRGNAWTAKGVTLAIWQLRRAGKLRRTVSSPVADTTAC